MGFAKFVTWPINISFVCVWWGGVLFPLGAYFLLTLNFFARLSAVEDITVEIVLLMFVDDIAAYKMFYKKSVHGPQPPKIVVNTNKTKRIFPINHRVF